MKAVHLCMSAVPKHKCCGVVGRHIQLPALAHSNDTQYWQGSENEKGECKARVAAIVVATYVQWYRLSRWILVALLPRPP